ncbi:winged helix-turn-helix transcriptional regulator [Streptomyces actuosus]|uniref:Winged helix-turn-helix transcriptional regulator n=1 Tax=Streptomyces actuosus TaxID=1885 RepID=A0ABS2VZ85_STRAS|nr:ArsR family transcriptional regulator [Streptomyces actuosus]MBN0048463.1 winged helix-turn-helix transcriptional regulator [Streptomyces actuosus]
MAAEAFADGGEPGGGAVAGCRTRRRVWGAGVVTSSRALSDLVGRSRAQLLEVVSQPLSTTELARGLGLSAGAISQHLGILHRAGLLDRARDGHTMLYSRTPLGDQLVD